MGFLDALLGRSRPVPPDLGKLFTLPAAALTLEARLGLHPTGTGAVCFRTAEGTDARAAQQDIVALLDQDAAMRTSMAADEYGYTWITCHRDDRDLAALTTALHMINSTLADAGLGQGLLCTVTGFAGAPGSSTAHPVMLVYLYKRGTFYPFVPADTHARDTETELAIRAALTSELPVEQDLGHWFALWNVPGM